MSIWMANWIRLPAKQSGRTCGIGVTVSKLRDFHAEVRRRTVENTSEILVDAYDLSFGKVAW